MKRELLICDVSCHGTDIVNVCSGGGLDLRCCERLYLSLLFNIYYLQKIKMLGPTVGDEKLDCVSKQSEPRAPRHLNPVLCRAYTPHLLRNRRARCI